MAGILSVADIGGVVDARTGSLSGDIGTSHDPIMHEIKPPETHGHSSISFENYHWWANRALEAEKHISTNAGLKQIFSVMVGKKIREEQPAETQPTSEELTDVKYNEKAPDGKTTSANGSDTNSKDGNGNGTKVVTKDRWGIAESEWY